MTSRNSFTKGRAMNKVQRQNHKKIRAVQSALVDALLVAMDQPFMAELADLIAMAWTEVALMKDVNEVVPLEGREWKVQYRNLDTFVAKHVQQFRREKENEHTAAA